MAVDTKISLSTLSTRLAKAEIFQSINYAVSDTLVSSPTTIDALPRVLRHIAEKLNFDLAIFWSIKDDPTILKFNCLWQNPTVDLTAFIDFSKKTTFSVSQSLPGRVLATRSPLWVDNFQTSRYLRSSVAAEVGLTTAVVFPVLADLEIVGVIELFSMEQAISADSDLLDMLIYTGVRIGQFIRRRALEQSLVELKMRYKLITEDIDEALIVSDSTGLIIEWNEAAESLFGWKRFQILGQPITIIMPEKYRAQHLEGLERVRVADDTYGSRNIGHVDGIEGLDREGNVFPIESNLATWNVGGQRYFSAVIKKGVDSHGGD
jgi:PAS domain S-box-containing protein